MNILVLTKRQYMGKDLLDDRFGRFYEIPEHLATMGHNVTGLCLSYRKRSEIISADTEITAGGVKWHSINLGLVPPLGLYRHMRKLDSLIKALKPDIIYGCSDILHAIFAKKVARRHGIRYAVDLYDNFESYSAIKIPGFKHYFIDALKDADGISVISERLRQYISTRYAITRNILVLGNAINKKLFRPIDKAESRKFLGLPQNAKLIGTAGALYRNRDIETLYSAFSKLSAQDSNIHLVLAGPRDKSVAIPGGENVHDLGLLNHQDVPKVYNALDIGIICNRDSAFGRYCYPQKFFEILACGTPVISASVGVLQDKLGDYKYALYQSGDPHSLASRIRDLLIQPRLPDLPVPGWEDRARTLESFFQQITETEHA